MFFNYFDKKKFDIKKLYYINIKEIFHSFTRIQLRSGYAQNNEKYTVYF